MTTYNTGNPLGSSDPRDLYDNAENLDNLVNGEQPSYDDRLGEPRKSWAGMEADFADFLANSGYELLGDYASGIEVTAYYQIVRESGEFWRAAAGTELPYTTTGSGMPEGGAFVSAGDAVLRQSLAAPTGADLVGLPIGTVGQAIDWVTPQMFGAVGDGVTDDTLAIQAALDSGRTVFFPKGDYAVYQQAEESFCLTLKKNVNLYGSGPRLSRIVSGMTSAPDVSLLKIDFSDPLQGFGDVRNWEMRGLGVTPYNGSAKHGVYIADGAPALNCLIESCYLTGSWDNGGYGLYLSPNKWAQSTVRNCGINHIFMGAGDANLFQQILMFGTGPAFTFDIPPGVRNNCVKDCTIVNRDGALHIINGDNIRFENNQLEQGQFYNPQQNQGPVSSMVWIEGRDRPCRNTIIRGNNFGGGTNVNHGLYIDNAYRSVIDANHFISVNIAEVLFTEKAKHNMLLPTQSFYGSQYNPRPGTLFKGKVIDAGTGNMGVLHGGDKLTLYNGWEAGGFYKNSDGVVRDIGGFSGGSTSAGAEIALLPEDYHPVIPFDKLKINQVDYTEALDNSAWEKFYTSVTPDAASAPDGHQSADLITHSSGGGSYSRRVRSLGLTLENSSQYTLSFYAKKAGETATQYIRAEINDGTFNRFVRVLANSDTGTVSVTHNSIYYDAVSSGSEAVGDGWYRFWVTFTTLTNTADPEAYSVGFTANNVLSIYSNFEGDPDIHKAFIWGVQLNDGALQDYQRVLAPDNFETVFKAVCVPAISDDGAGHVKISRQGLITVGSLPSNANVVIAPFQSSVTQEPG